jgi:hypothetical protein
MAETSGTQRGVRRHAAKQRREATKARYGTQVNVSDPEGDYCCCCKANLARLVVNVLLVVSESLIEAACGSV